MEPEGISVPRFMDSNVVFQSNLRCSFLDTVLSSYFTPAASPPPLPGPQLPLLSHVIVNLCLPWFRRKKKNTKDT